MLLGLAAPAGEVAKTLALPISTGSIALLATHGREPGVSERLGRALIAPDAEIRGVAARVVDAAGLSELLPEVSAALEKENDSNAAREQIRALLGLGGSRYESSVLPAAARLSPNLDAQLVRIVARTRGPAALPLYFNDLRNLSLTPRDREAFFRIASQGRADTLHAGVALALGRGDAPSFQAALRVATEFGLTLDQPVFVQALRSEQPSFRGEAAWYLARIYCDRPPEGADALLEAA